MLAATQVIVFTPAELLKQGTVAQTEGKIPQTHAGKASRNRTTKVLGLPGSFSS